MKLSLPRLHVNGGFDGEGIADAMLDCGDKGVGVLHVHGVGQADVEGYLLVVAVAVEVDMVDLHVVLGFVAGHLLYLSNQFGVGRFAKEFADGVLQDAVSGVADH